MHDDADREITMTNLNIACLQQAFTDSPHTNIAELTESIISAAQAGAQLILLPELHNSLYFCQTENPQYFALAETIPGPSTEHFSQLAAKLKVVLVISLFEKRTHGLYHNTAVVIDGKHGMVGKYRKMHIPDDPGYYEKYYFTPGDQGFQPIETSLGKLGVLICWDQWFPEAARLMALRGADILLYPTAIGWAPEDSAAEKDRQRQAWQTIQRSHAIANGIPVISCNRVGFESDPSEQTQGIDFWGQSFACDAMGSLITTADHTPTLLSATINLSDAQQYRHNWPFLRDRRVDAYSEIDQLYGE